MILDLLESRHHQNIKIIYDKNKNTMENDNSGDTGDNSNNSNHTDLVGGFNPLKNMKVSWDDEIPNI